MHRISSTTSLKMPRHIFHEDQALLRVQSRLDSLLELRSGRAIFYRKRREEVQLSTGKNLAPGILKRMDTMETLFHEIIADFKDMNPQVNGHVLVRDRWVNHPRNRQESDMIWGTLKAEGIWNISFGGHSKETIQFRRGPWEHWSVDLPLCAQFGRKYPVAFSPYCATLMHEAVGHALEDEYLQNSPLKPKIGTRFCHEEITLSDQPEIPGLAGSMKLDDTGQEATETLLIHRGCFVGDLDQSKGVWRRGSYKAEPLIRTTNAILKPGSANPDDWFKYLPDMYYISWVETGKWLPGTQDIEFVTGPVFRIHRGEPTSFFPSLKLKCKSLEFLKSIQAIGNDTRLDPLVHWCFKKRQGVPMSLLSPSILVDNCFTEHGGEASCAMEK